MSFRWWFPGSGLGGKVTTEQRDSPNILLHKFYPHESWGLDGFNQTSLMHILPLCSSVSCTKPWEAANADLCENAAEREQSLTYRLSRSSLDTAAAVRRSILLLFAVLHSRHAARFGLPRTPPTPPFTVKTSTTTPSGGAVLHVALLLAFFLSSTSEFEGRSQHGLILTERQRGGLLAWWGGKEARLLPLPPSLPKVYWIWCLPGRSSCCVSCD